VVSLPDGAPVEGSSGQQCPRSTLPPRLFTARIRSGEEPEGRHINSSSRGVVAQPYQILFFLSHIDLVQQFSTMSPPLLAQGRPSRPQLAPRRRCIAVYLAGAAGLPSSPRLGFANHRRRNASRELHRLQARDNDRAAAAAGKAVRMAHGRRPHDCFAWPPSLGFANRTARSDCA
jgi:hypothetical protein